LNKPIQLSKHNWTLTGCAGRFLDPDEVMLETDFIREMYERPMPSESGGWDACFEPEDWRGPAWHLVKEEFPAWGGCTYVDFMNFGNTQAYVGHEIFRVDSTSTKDK